jgi:hypothetical protein
MVSSRTIAPCRAALWLVLLLLRQGKTKLKRRPLWRNESQPRSPRHEQGFPIDVPLRCTLDCNTDARVESNTVGTQVVAVGQSKQLGYGVRFEDQKEAEVSLAPVAFPRFRHKLCIFQKCEIVVLSFWRWSARHNLSAF